jgi:hypothetical protein
MAPWVWSTAGSRTIRPPVNWQWEGSPQGPMARNRLGAPSSPLLARPSPQQPGVFSELMRNVWAALSVHEMVNRQTSDPVDKEEHRPDDFEEFLKAEYRRLGKALTQRYIYLGDRMTAERWRGQPCDPVRDAHARRRGRREGAGDLRRREPDCGEPPATAAEGEAPMNLTSRRNAYFCRSCHGMTLVDHADPGVTPMFLACRRGGLSPEENPRKGTAASLMYPPEQFFRLLLGVDMGRRVHQGQRRDDDLGLRLDRSASSTAGFSDSEGDCAPENLFPVHPARSVRRKSRAEGEATVGLRSGAVRAVNRKAAKRRGRVRLQRNLYHIIALIVGAAGIASSLLLWALVKGYPCVGMDVSPCRHTLMPMLVGSGTVVLAAGIALLGTRTE